MRPELGSQPLGALQGQDEGIVIGEAVRNILIVDRLVVISPSIFPDLVSCQNQRACGIAVRATRQMRGCNSFQLNVLPPGRS